MSEDFRLAANDLLRRARLGTPSPSGSGRPMSRQELADAVNTYLARWDPDQATLDANQIGKLERGHRRWPGRLRREAFRHVLHATADRELGFHIIRGMGSEGSSDPSDKRPVRDGSTNDRPEVDILGQTVDPGWADMLRRTVLLTSVSTAIQQLTRCAGFEGGTEPVTGDTLTDMCRVAVCYRRAYHTVPASRLLPAAQAHLDVIRSCRPASQPSTYRRALMTAAGEMAALTGVLLGLDASRRAESLTYLDLAWAAAREAEDVELQTVVLGCRSFAVSYAEGDHRAGLECADLGRRVGARGACPETRGWVAAVASERCASLGDVAGCQRRLDESRQALSTAEPRGPVWRGIGGFNADKLLAYEGGHLTRLGRFVQAETILDDAIDRLDPTMHRHRATALIDRADARLGFGDVDAACDDARQALRLVVRVQHLGNLDRIQNICDRGAALGASAARDLRHETRLVRADHGLPTRWEIP